MKTVLMAIEIAELEIYSVESFPDPKRQTEPRRNCLNALRRRSCAQPQLPPTSRWPFMDAWQWPVADTCRRWRRQLMPHSEPGRRAALGAVQRFCPAAAPSALPCDRLSCSLPATAHILAVLYRCSA